MIKNEELKTSPKQRILAILVAVLMLGSTAALYIGIVLGNQNQEQAEQISSEKQARFEKLYSEYQDQVAAQANTLSDLYFNEFASYRGNVKAFNAAGVTALKVQDLKVGEGREIASLDDIDYAAYYIGWLSDETIFDSSFNDIENPTRLNAPLTGSTSMIQGWIEGIARSEQDSALQWEGMRIGGVREITIPSTMAYGEIERDKIPANSPLKFIVKLIDKPEQIEISDELAELYSEIYE